MTEQIVDTCGICQEDMSTLRRGEIDCCKHIFCEACITKQFQYNSRCPMCREPYCRVNGVLQHKLGSTSTNSFHQMNENVNEYDNDEYEDTGQRIHQSFVTVDEDEEDYHSNLRKQSLQPRPVKVLPITMFVDTRCCYFNKTTTENERLRIQSLSFFGQYNPIEELDDSVMRDDEQTELSTFPMLRHQPPTPVSEFRKKWSRYAIP